MHWPRCLWFLLVLASLSLAGAAETNGFVFEVQLIRGTNDKKPPEPKAKPIGPKLSQRLEPVFRWQHYWEIGRHEVRVTEGKVTKLPLQLRELEIRLLPKGQLELRLYQNGALVRTSRQKLQGANMEIMGGTSSSNGKGDDNAWFVVVRESNPPAKQP